MTPDAKAQRHAAIEAAAYELLAERGFERTSMLEIAKRAKASNQTLYAWYGDKIGLFTRMVQTNVSESRAVLDEALNHGEAPLEALRALGPVLLEMLLGDRAVLLNRVAASDGTGTLGRVIAEGGRAQIAPLIGRLLGQAHHAGTLRFDDAGEAATLYLNLLIGDLQIRRVIGALAPPSPDFIAQRAELAFDTFLRLSKP